MNPALSQQPREGQSCSRNHTVTDQQPVPTAPREALPRAAAGFPSKLLRTRRLNAGRSPSSPPLPSPGGHCRLDCPAPGSGLGSEENTGAQVFSQLLPWG